MGFEPTVPFRITGFQDQLHKPLGHPSTDSLVRRTGIEPVRPFGSADFKSAASACSATLAYFELGTKDFGAENEIRMEGPRLGKARLYR